MNDIGTRTQNVDNVTIMGYFVGRKLDQIGHILIVD